MPIFHVLTTDKIIIKKRKEFGFSTLSLLISISFLSAILVAVQQYSSFAKDDLIKYRDVSDITNLNHYISSNFSCIETRRRNPPCNNVSQEVTLYSKRGNKLIELEQEFKNIQVKAECVTQVNGFKYEVKYRILKHPDAAWETLQGDDTFFSCHDLHCPRYYYGDMELVVDESWIDVENGTQRCTYNYTSFNCPSDDDMHGMASDPDRYFAFVRKRRTRFVDGIQRLDCYYELFCNNPTKSKWTLADSCWND